MGRPKRKIIIYFSRCSLCILIFGLGVNTIKNNAFNFTKPTSNHMMEKEKTENFTPLESGGQWLHTKIDYTKYASTCLKKNVSLLKTAMPLTGLVSFPGSGNTWTRHLIQQMTGVGTSSVYCDEILKSRGFPYECNQKERNKTIVIKTHAPEHVQKFSKVIFLIRNLYDAFLTFANYKTAGHTQRTSVSKLKQALNEMFKGALKLYVNLTWSITTQFKGPVYILQYEKLKADMYTELKNIAKFLEVNVTNHDIHCTVQLQEGNFHRNLTDEKRNEILHSIYDNEKLLKLQETVRYIETLLKDANYVDIVLRGPEEHVPSKK